MSKTFGGNYGGLYSPDQVSNPGDCKNWFYCTDDKDGNGKSKCWKKADDLKITKIGRLTFGRKFRRNIR